MQFLQVHFLDIFRFFNTSEGSCQEEMQALSPIVIIIEGLEIDFDPTRPSCSNCFLGIGEPVFREFYPDIRLADHGNNTDTDTQKAEGYQIIP